MKPRRPTEKDLLAIVQNGFASQWPMDREAQPQEANLPAMQGGAPDPMVPMVRITVSIPEALRFRLKLAVMSHRRSARVRLTQDDFCAQAIAAHLNLLEGTGIPPEPMGPVVVFLRECLEGGGLNQEWIPRAKALLAHLQSDLGQRSQPGGSPLEPEPGSRSANRRKP